MNPFFSFVSSGDRETIERIAGWYLAEWNIDRERTLRNLTERPNEIVQFQILMNQDGRPIGTGGLYRRVSLQERIQKFGGLCPWVALLYTEPPVRGRGLGAQLLGEIERRAREIGEQKIYLFTHTARPLYERNGWNVLEMVQSAGKNIAVMEKSL